MTTINEDDYGSVVISMLVRAGKVFRWESTSQFMRDLDESKAAAVALSWGAWANLVEDLPPGMLKESPLVGRRSQAGQSSTKFKLATLMEVQLSGNPKPVFLGILNDTLVYTDGYCSPLDWQTEDGCYHIVGARYENHR